VFGLVVALGQFPEQFFLTDATTHPHNCGDHGQLQGLSDGTSGTGSNHIAQSLVDSRRRAPVVNFSTAQRLDLPRRRGRLRLLSSCCWQLATKRDRPSPARAGDFSAPSLLAFSCAAPLTANHIECTEFLLTSEITTTWKPRSQAPWWRQLPRKSYQRRCVHLARIELAAFSVLPDPKRVT